MLGVRLDDELEQKLAQYARQTGRSKSDCAKEALEEYFRRRQQQDEHDRLTRKGCRQLDRGEAVPAADVFRMLDSWGHNSDL